MKLVDLAIKTLQTLFLYLLNIAISVDREFLKSLGLCEAFDEYLLFAKEAAVSYRRSVRFEWTGREEEERRVSGLTQRNDIRNIVTTHVRNVVGHPLNKLVHSIRLLLPVGPALSLQESHRRTPSVPRQFRPNAIEEYAVVVRGRERGNEGA